MLARTFLTGLREDEDDEDEGVKLNADELRTLPALLDIESLDCWREASIRRMKHESVESRGSVAVCVCAWS